MTSSRVSIREFTIYLPAILFAPPPATEGVQQLVCRTKGTREALEIFSIPGDSQYPWMPTITMFDLTKPLLNFLLPFSSTYNS